MRPIGEVISEFTFNHEAFGEKFYFVSLSVTRLSGQVDVIPTSISERLMDISKRLSRHDDGGAWTVSFLQPPRRRKKPFDTVRVRTGEVRLPEEPAGYTGTNQTFLDGYICKKPIYRRTPMGREIADMLLAVNRLCRKTDYIPCIVWGRNARYASGFDVGSHVCVEGRIQSREYMKKLSETECEKHVAYEVSVSKYLDNRRSLEKGEDDGGGVA